MALILPFVRISHADGWTAAERMRLSLLAERLPASEAGLEVVFGVTDTGDPWCVVKDRDEEVLVHVARIEGRFLVHHAAEDVLREGAELWTLLIDLMQAPELPEPVAQVVPYTFSNRQVQMLIAVLTAAAFYHETAAGGVFAGAAVEALAASGASGPAPAADAVPVDAAHAAAASAQPAAAAPMSAEPDAAPPAQAWRPVPVELASPPSEPHAPKAPPAEAAPAPVAPPAPVAVAVQHRPVATAETADEPAGVRLVGTAAAEVLRGGAGADTLDGGGAPDGFADLLLGEGGDDIIALGRAVIAHGGEGADTFTFSFVQTAAADAQPADFGVILDFAAAEGDRLVFAGQDARAVSTAQVTDVLAGFRADPAVADWRPTPGVRLGVDLTGDGLADGFVLLAHPTVVLDRPYSSEDAPRSTLDPDFPPPPADFVV